MIIPIRCFTCGKVLADKWNFYKEKADAIDTLFEKQQLTKYDAFDIKTKMKKEEEGETKMYKNLEPTYKKKILDSLGLNKMCCRRHMITHVDMMGKI